AAALLVHDLGEHGGRFTPLAERLAGHGFVTVAPDLRGHGRSDGRRGHVSRFEIFLQDLDRFRRVAQGLTDPGCPLFLLATGLGGLVVLRYLQEFGAPVSGAVLAAPWIAGVPFPSTAASFARVLGRVLPAIRLSTGSDAPRRSRGPAARPAQRDDPLAHDAFTPRLYNEVTAAMRQVPRRRCRLAVPVLVLLGEDDRIADQDRTAALLHSLDGAALEVRRCAGRAHEALHGTAPEAVLSDVTAWLEDQIEGSAAETAVSAGIALALRGARSE